MGKTILVLSGKGGTGKSMFTANMGLTLASQGHKTVILDMNMGMRSLDLYVGLESMAIFDMYDVIMRTCDPETALIHSDLNNKLYMMPTRQGPEWMDISIDDVTFLIDYLREQFEYIIMDASSGMGRAIDLCLESTDEAVIVTMPDYSAIRDADAVEDYLIRSEIFNRRYVLNRMLPELEPLGCEPEVNEIDKRLRCEMLGMIMEDENIRASTNIGVPIVAKKDTYIARNFDKMARRLIKDLGGDSE